MKKYKVFFRFRGSGASGSGYIVVKAESEEDAKVQVKKMFAFLPNLMVFCTYPVRKGRKTVMYFKSKKALNFLLENGHIYTIRWAKIKADVVWITSKRGGKKIADAVVAYIGEVVQVVPDNEWYVADKASAIGKLDEFVNESGFNSVEDWLEEVKKLNGGKLPEKMYLYYVKLVGDV